MKHVKHLTFCFQIVFSVLLSGCLGSDDAEEPLSSSSVDSLSLQAFGKDGAAALSWIGGQSSGLRYRVSQGESTNESSVVPMAETSIESHEADGLSNGTSYRFTVEEIDEAGESAGSFTEAVVTPSDWPEPDLIVGSGDLLSHLPVSYLVIDSESNVYALSEGNLDRGPFYYEWRDGELLTAVDTSSNQGIENPNSIGYSSLPHSDLTVDCSGIPHVVIQSDGEIFHTHLVDGLWTDRVQISDDSERASIPTKIAISSDGTVYTIWPNSGSSEFLYALFEDTGWTVPVHVDFPGNGDLDGQSGDYALGNGDVLHLLGDCPSSGTCYYKYENQDRSEPNPIPKFSEDAIQFDYSLVVDENGIVHIAWSEFLDPTSDQSILSIFYSKLENEQWSDPMALFSTNAGYGMNAGNVEISVDCLGKVHVLWNEEHWFFGEVEVEEGKVAAAGLSHLILHRQSG